MTDADGPNPDLRPTPFTWFVRGCGCLAVLALIAIILPAMSRAHGGRRFSCANNLKQIGLTLKMYSNEDGAELFPTLSREPGRLMFDSVQVYPEFLPDPAIEFCPYDEDFKRFARKPKGEEYIGYLRDDVEPVVAIDDWSYFYLGYAVRSDEDVERFAAAYREHLRTGVAMEDDLRALDDPNGAHTLYRLREGVERVFVEAEGLDINDPGASALMQSEIPILFERVGNHLGGVSARWGANILYLDGHVEFIDYPGKWPMTEKTVRILNELDALGSPN